MPLRIAFAGFRHGHIFSLLKMINENPETEVVAACEEDEATRTALSSRDDLTITHDNYERMLSEVDCDAVAIGDYYTKRGGMVIKAMELGKHVLSDKPICCELDELDRICELSRTKKLSITSQLDLRGVGVYRTMKRLADEGRIGQVHSVSFMGQHPLSLGVRPQWYFEEGKHGGTINDLALHGVDAITWITGGKITEVTAARVWNARAKQYPFFQDGAQLLLKLDNNGGAFGDVSYLRPEKVNSDSLYWRFTFLGSEGMMEATLASKQVMLARNNETDAEMIDIDANTPTIYVDSFLNELKGNQDAVELSTADVLYASYVSLVAQKAAENNQTNVDCSRQF